MYKYLRCTKLFFISFALLLVHSCNDDIYNPDAEKKVDKEKQSDIIEDNIVKVKFSPEFGENFTDIKNSVATKGEASTEINNLLEKVGAKNIFRLFPYNEEYDNLMRKYGLHLWYVIEYDETAPKTKSVSDISSIEGVEIVEKVRRISGFKDNSIPYFAQSANTKADDGVKLPFNDKMLIDQWSYYNDGSLAGAKKGADINLFKAWEKGVKGRPEVIVAIIDGGVEYSHQDLKDNMYQVSGKLDGYDNEDLNGYNFCGTILYDKDSVIKRKPNGSVERDNTKLIGKISSHFHGTHVAGTIAAKNGNGEGGCGIAGGDGTSGSGVRLLSCQIIDNYGATPYYERAFVYAQMRGAVIAQCSWGWDPGQYTETMFNTPVEGSEKSLKAAIDYFIDNAGCDEKGQQKADSPMKGGLVVFAAGNTPVEFESYPALYERVIAVTAMAPDFRRSDFTTYGTWADIMAPGGVSASHYFEKRNILSTYPGNEYRWLPGTSMACPHVSGIAALVVSKYGVGQMGFTADSLKKQLLSALRPYDIYEYNPEPLYRNKLGKGYIDADRALSINENFKPSNIGNIKIDSLYKEMILSWNAVADTDDETADFYDLYVSENELYKGNYLSASRKIEVNALRFKQGENITFIVNELDDDKKYYFALVARDRWGLVSDPSFIEGKTKVNHAPKLTLQSDKVIKLTNDETGYNKILVDEVDIHTEKWTYKVIDKPKGVVFVEEKDGISMDFYNKANTGVYTFTVVVTDMYGLETSIAISFETYENNSPKFVKPLDKIYVPVNSSGVLYDLADYVADPDGHKLKYEVKLKNFDACLTSQNESYLSIIPDKIGNSAIELIVTDEHGARLRKTIQICVVEDKLVYSIYPIPVTDKLNVRLSDRVQDATIKVRNINGAVMFKKQISNITDERLVVIDMRKFASGTYVLDVESNGESYKESFIKI